MKDTTAVAIFKVLPKSFLSRLFGGLTRLPLPGFLMRPVIRWYCARYGVKEEFDTPTEGFRTFNAFFTRALRPGVHCVDPDPRAVVSPVDARIDQYGDLHDDALIQAKGLGYSVKKLVPSAQSASFIGGSFMTLYLSPGDYHRIHSPVSGTIIGYVNTPGTLYTVQDYMVALLPDLFICNERVTSLIRTPGGMVGVCKVGALNVGRISLSYAPEITNKTFRKAREVRFDEGRAVPVARGEEIGRFNLGSTVILLFEKGMIQWENFEQGAKVRMGERIGRYLTR